MVKRTTPSVFNWTTMKPPRSVITASAALLGAWVVVTSAVADDAETIAAIRRIALFVEVDYKRPN